MGRYVQLQGLSLQAESFIDLYSIQKFKTDKKVIGWMDEELHSLQIYGLEDGSLVEEYVQAEVWDSGPMIYLALRDQFTKEPLRESLWNLKKFGIE